MALNQAQNKLLEQFAVKFTNHSPNGTVHPNCHIRDVKVLVEACIQANDGVIRNQIADQKTS